jgi:DNA-directed RNA polymerase specialized sigma54-like protein
MKRIIKLTENDLTRIVRRVIKENEMSEKEESKDTLRKQLHTLVGSEMRLGKRANMSGAEHHTEEHKKAEKKLNDFLEDNPSMEKYLDEVEEHFYKQLFR